MFVSNLSITLVIVLTVTKVTSGASLSEPEGQPVVIETAKDQPSDAVNYVDSTQSNSPSLESTTNNSTDPELGPVKSWFYRAIDFVENAFTGEFRITNVKTGFFLFSFFWFN